MSDSTEWQDERPDELPDEHTPEAEQPADAEATEEPSYVPPDQLPPPEFAGSSFPLVALLLGGLVAVVLGGVLFMASQFIYVYLLYNAWIGISIGKMIARAPERNRFTNVPFLFAATGVCSVLAYVAYNVALHQWVLQQNPGFQLGFLDFVWLRAQVNPFLAGVQPGAAGTIIIWLAELGITQFYAWKQVRVAVQVCELVSVPSEVVEFVSYLYWQNADDEHIRAELSKRGWTLEEDQTRAIRAFRTMNTLR